MFGVESLWKPELFKTDGMYSCAVSCSHRVCASEAKTRCLGRLPEQRVKRSIRFSVVCSRDPGPCHLGEETCRAKTHLPLGREADRDLAIDQPAQDRLRRLQRPRERRRDDEVNLLSQRQLGLQKLGQLPALRQAVLGETGIVNQEVLCFEVNTGWRGGRIAPGRLMSCVCVVFARESICNSC